MSDGDGSLPIGRPPAASVTPANRLLAFQVTDAPASDRHDGVNTLSSSSPPTSPIVVTPMSHSPAVATKRRIAARLSVDVTVFKTVEGNLAASVNWTATDVDVMCDEYVVQWRRFRCHPHSHNITVDCTDTERLQAIVQAGGRKV